MCQFDLYLYPTNGNNWTKTRERRSNHHHHHRGCIIFLALIEEIEEGTASKDAFPMAFQMHNMHIHALWFTWRIKRYPHSFLVHDSPSSLYAKNPSEAGQKHRWLAWALIGWGCPWPYCRLDSETNSCVRSLDTRTISTQWDESTTFSNAIKLNIELEKGTLACTISDISWWWRWSFRHDAKYGRSREWHVKKDTLLTLLRDWSVSN